MCHTNRKPHKDICLQAMWTTVRELLADRGTVLVDGSATSFQAWHSHQYPSPLWYTSTSSRNTSILACRHQQQSHHHHQHHHQQQQQHCKARFPFKRNCLRCVCCVNENRKKRKRLHWQAANHGCHCFDRAFLLAGACVCCVKLRFLRSSCTQRTQRKRLR